MAELLSPAATLFHGVDEVTNRLLQTPSYRHRTLLRRHKANPPVAKTGFDLTLEIYSQIQQNFSVILREAKPDCSSENWRCVSPGTECHKRNKPREVGLERALVAACQQFGRKDWWNQVPVASGLLNGSAGKRRAIDLVHRRGPTAYDLVELKLKSDTPIYAAVEILQYGFLWLLSRQAKDKLGYIKPSLLDADDIGLSVLAPTPFYVDTDYGEFGAGVDAAVKKIAQEHRISMSFGLKRFPSAFKWAGVGDNRQLCGMLDVLYPG